MAGGVVAVNPSIVTVDLRAGTASGAALVDTARFTLLQVDATTIACPALVKPLLAQADSAEQLLEAATNLGSVILVDRLQRRMHLQRDRVGVGRLYWHTDGRRLHATGDLRALVRVIRPPRLCSEGIFLYLAHQYFPYDCTPFEGIRKVEPGTRVVIEDNGRQDRRRYWRPGHGSGIHRLEDFIERARETAARTYEAVAIRHNALAIMCSGGVDSTANAAWLAQSGRRPIALTATFEDAAFDETPYAAEVARLFGLPHEIAQVDHMALLESRRTVAALIEPIGDQAALATARLLAHCETSGLRFDAIVSGEGGDELWGPPRRFDPALHVRHDSSAAVSLASAYLNAAACLPPQEASGLLVERMQAGLAAERLARLYDEAPSPDAMSQLKFGQLLTWLPENVLTKDRSLIGASGAQAVFPLIAPEFVDLYCSATAEVQFEASRAKTALLGTYAHCLSPLLVQKPKHRFVLPMGDWMADLSATCMHELDRNGWLLEVLDRDAMRRYVSRCNADPHNTHRRLWTLFVLLIWIKQFE